MKFFKCEICSENHDGTGIYLSGYVTDTTGGRFRASIQDVCQMCYATLSAKCRDPDDNTKMKTVDLKGLWKVTPLPKRGFKAND